MKARAEASRLHGPITQLGLVPLLLHDLTPINKKERSVDLTPWLNPDRYYRGRSFSFRSGPTWMGYSKNVFP